VLSVARTSQIVDQTTLKNRIEAVELPYLKDLYKKRLEDLRDDIKALEKEILDLIRGDEAYKRYFQILTSIPGIGNICAIILVAGMPELGRASNKEIAVLVGVAPLNWDSGTMRGKREIRGGRHVVRKALYMPALSVATRWQVAGVSG
jgi:transposase